MVPSFLTLFGVCNTHCNNTSIYVLGILDTYICIILVHQASNTVHILLFLYGGSPHSILTIIKKIKNLKEK